MSTQQPGSDTANPATSAPSKTSWKTRWFEFNRDKHIQFLRRCVACLPMEYAQQDNNHLTLVYFVLGALEILGETDTALDEATKRSLVEYVYSLQVLPMKGATTDERRSECCGFLGSSYQYVQAKDYCISNSAMTYVAIAILIMMKDDLSRVNVPAITAALRALQQHDGRLLFFTVVFVTVKFCCCCCSWRG